MTTSFDRKMFFDALRLPLFHGLEEDQVAGCSAILDEAERRYMRDQRFVAYMLATAFWETGRSMQPIRETGHGRGKAYGIADPVTRKAYYGRGLVQLTWKENYAKMSASCGVDLVSNPDLALRLDIAVRVLFEGMLDGLFTGRKLADFFHADLTDWIGARRIINGTDQAATIADFAHQFHAALVSATKTPVVPNPTSRAPPPPSLVARLKAFFNVNTGRSS